MTWPRGTVAPGSEVLRFAAMTAFVAEVCAGGDDVACGYDAFVRAMATPTPRHGPPDPKDAAVSERLEKACARDDPRACRELRCDRLACAAGG